MKTTMRREVRRCTVAAALVLGLLAGCGGGGHGSSASPTGNAAPQPVITLAGAVSAGAGIADVSTATGSTVLLDAGGSTDPEGDPVSFGWSLVSKPATSALDLSGATPQLNFKADVAGTYVINVHVSDSHGAYADKRATILVQANAAPAAALSATVVLAPAQGSGTNTVAASVGYTVALSGLPSTDPELDVLTYAWSLVSQPAGSTAALDTATGAFSQFAPDVMGDYVVRLVATDPSGAATSYQTTVSVKNRRPQASISSNSTPVALATGPALRLPVGTTLTLRGTGSVDADGDAITYAWTLDAKPPTSSAALSAATGSTVQLTTDVDGTYNVRLRVTDTSGAYSEQLLAIVSGNAPPVAVLDKSRMSVLAGVAANATAAASFDDDGDTLSYSWAIDARPSGSSATIATPNTAQLSFTPDVGGTYVASLTVSDGKSSNVAYLTINALNSNPTDVTLPFAPLDARYSKGLDRFVAVATNPNALYIVDPFTGTTRTVPLPLAVKAFSLSADGKLAAVLHEGVVSLVDLASATVLHSSTTGGSQTDAFVTNAGMIYMIGQTGGQWVNPAVSVVNGRTGDNLNATLGKAYAAGYFYGTQRGIFAATKQKAFLISNGLTPADISYFTLNAATGAVDQTGDSPYHGDYAMNMPFYLTANEDLLFTSSGTFFRTDTLQYAGRLSLNANTSVQSMSHSSSADAAIVMTNTTNTSSYPYTPVYEASYHQFIGGLFVPAADVALPVIGGLQSYGIGIFYSANDNHVALVQTGGTGPNPAGVKYYLVTR